MCWWPPLQLSSQNPPSSRLTFMLHTRFVSRAILGAIHPFHFLTQDCLPACFPARPSVRPSACAFASCLCPFPSLLIIFIIILSLLDFIVHTDRPSIIFAWPLQRPAATTNQSHTIGSYPGFSICTPSRPPRPALCTFRCWANRAPFYLLYPPRLVRHQVPVTGRASKHVTYPSSLFFFSSSPLELSASLDLLAHRQNSRDLFPCRHLCTCG